MGVPQRKGERRINSCCERQVAKANGYRVQYIGLNIADAELSRPGGFEANGTGNADDATHARDRHVILP